MADKPLKKKTNSINSTTMSFGDHLTELRSRMIKSIIGLLVGFGVCLLFGSNILGFITTPVLMAMEANGYEPQLISLSPPETFLVFIKTSLIAGLFLASPWVFYQMWGFIAAGLHKHEQRYVNFFVPFSATLFVLGGVFFILVVAPISFNFFINFSSKWQASDYSDSFFFRRLLGGGKQTVEVVEPNAAVDAESPKDNIKKPSIRFEYAPKKYIALVITLTPDYSGNFFFKQPPGGAEQTIEPVREVDAETPKDNIKKPLVKPTFAIQKYISLVIVLALAFGLAFQMPLAVFLLGRLSLVRLKTFRSIRKYMLFGIVIFSAMITPPDVISQILMSLPMYLLYELGILLLWIWPKRRNSNIPPG